MHGGGWSTESVETYDRICSMLSKSVDKTVISVEYRLAPEYPFPAGLEDCYLAARALYQGKIFPKIEPGQISVMGDSSGGNLAAALCLLARDRGEFSIHKQILVYPAVNNCYTLDSAYDSIRENGEGYLLTRGKMHDYLQLYIGKQEDLKSPYVAPVLAEDLTNMPETLVLSAEFDPLRDEGEDYAKRLKEAGNKVTCYRIAGAFHGYFALGVSRLHVEESFAYIDHFLREG
ncbi:alpha/beta hydrolase [[Ruminococcus] gnavus]|uniref:Lipase n=1 Tax=Mediterraneibacter gnavus TaxID=33038 RepID=A0A2N5NHS0_MEDGN|nr:alpha/beta hydrolase [Lachnospiraceae bacterium]NSD44819.1 alpha/beta hydrolase [Mediterraneibacter gnavus]NSG45202.1 alpha/beta hydrolase [Mediterraneibacter gnavus]NSH05666.1 alpha/beta hydrolase [Mediterraneibacter gnavus]NSH72631.1 alpha/beta hydrolase [Mediterraneibacter gnavus]